MSTIDPMPMTSAPTSTSDPATSTGGPGAAERTKAAASTGAEKGKEVVGTAAAGAKEVAGEAKRGVASVVGTGTEEAQRMLGEARYEARRQADTQAVRISAGLRALGQQLSSIANGEPVDQGRVREVADQASTRVSNFADRLTDEGVDGVLQDVAGYARRRPGMFLAGAAVVGFAAGRMLRGAKAAQDEGGESSSTASYGSSQTPSLGTSASLPLVGGYAEPLPGYGGIDRTAETGPGAGIA